MSPDSGFRWQSASRSEVGNVRKLNEDACLDAPGRGLWVVADGMGGHEAGDLASQMVVEDLDRVEAPERFGAFVDEVEDCVLLSNQRLYAMAHQSDEPRVIGCTLACMLAYGNHCLSIWAGDSRVYRLRGGKLDQITRDHSEVEEMIARGEIKREEAESHPSANVITRAVGGIQNLYLDLTLERLEDGDRYLICSDGLYKDLSAGDIEERLGTGGCVDACNELMDTALSRECPDNVTVVVVDFNEIESDPL